MAGILSLPGLSQPKDAKTSRRLLRRSVINGAGSRDGPARAVLVFVLLRLAAGAVPPVIENSGHDFALLTWQDEAPAEPVVAYRIFSSRWVLSYLKYHAPDLTGSYVLNGQRLDVCSRPDGALGTWRLVALLSSEDSIGVAMATWSLAEGGYAGGMLFSNASFPSGERLLLSHRDGSLHLLGSAYDLLAPTGQEPPPLSIEDFERVGESEAACPLLSLARPATLTQRGAPDISGHYFSVFNESLAVCTACC